MCQLAEINYFPKRNKMEHPYSSNKSKHHKCIWGQNHVWFPEIGASGVFRRTHDSAEGETCWCPRLSTDLDPQTALCRSLAGWACERMAFPHYRCFLLQAQNLEETMLESDVREKLETLDNHMQEVLQLPKRRRNLNFEKTFLWRTISYCQSRGRPTCRRCLQSLSSVDCMLRWSHAASKRSLPTLSPHVAELRLHTYWMLKSQASV